MHGEQLAVVDTLKKHNHCLLQCALLLLWMLYTAGKQDHKDKNALTYQIAQRLRIVPCTISLTGKRGNTGQLMRIEVVTCVLHDRVWNVRCGTACWLCDCERSIWYVERIWTDCVKI